MAKKKRKPTGGSRKTYKERLFPGDLVEFPRSSCFDKKGFGIVILEEYKDAWYVYCQTDGISRWMSDYEIKKVNYK